MLKYGCVFCKIVGLIAAIGAINWGLVGLLDFNLVAFIFGAGSMAARIVYGLVGLCGLILLIGLFTGCPGCRTRIGNREL